MYAQYSIVKGCRMAWCSNSVSKLNFAYDPAQPKNIAHWQKLHSSYISNVLLS